jgi:MFS family permease
LAILSLGHSEVVPMGQKRDSFQSAVLRTGFAAMTEHVEAQRDVPAFLDRQPVRWLHLALAVVCGLGFAFDLLEMALGTVLAAVFSTPPNLVSSNELSWLLAPVYVGAVIGAPALGWLADRLDASSSWRWCSSISPVVAVGGGSRRRFPHAVPRAFRLGAGRPIHP